MFNPALWVVSLCSVHVSRWLLGIPLCFLPHPQNGKARLDSVSFNNIECILFVIIFPLVLVFIKPFLSSGETNVIFLLQCTRQVLSEKLGRGSKTVDLELESQIEILRETKRKYENLLRLARQMASQFYQVVQTQRQLGDAFGELSVKSPELHVSSLFLNTSTNSAI